MKPKVYPFTAIKGQDPMKEALILNLVNPAIGGVLIRGEKGTAKTTAVRGISGILPGRKVVEIPMNATEDRVAGTIDLEYMLKNKKERFEPGLLKEADGQILYVDEINLLEDHIVNLLLDAAATGVNTVEREGISVSHPSRFVLIGTMNPEEGRLRPQLLDRFGMVVDITGEKDPEVRVAIIKDRMAFEKDPAAFLRKYAKSQRELKEKILLAQEMLDEVSLPDELLLKAAEISIALGVQGHRADLSMIKTAMTLAAFRGERTVNADDLKKAAFYVLPHRMRRSPLEKGEMDPAVLEGLFRENASQNSINEQTKRKQNRENQIGETRCTEKQCRATRNREKQKAGEASGISDAG
ncbi:MAG: AAA family ATPase [Eubacterium sp.]|nr:AAA family ATPase [Eubacterium sp.]